jgi:hypothetical protein
MNSATQPQRSFRRLSPTAAFVTAALVLAVAIPLSAQQERVLYRFTGGADGDDPQSGLIADSSGNLYGATYTGAVDGTAYKLSPPAEGGQWTETNLHTFGASGDGAGVISVMTVDSAGNLYGTTSAGGLGVGIVFQLVPPSAPGGAWTENVLYSFKGNSDGASPYGGVILDQAGNLYGTTDGNFETTFGTVFELSPPATQGAAWTEAILYSFKGTTDGCGPNGKLVLGANGVLYGTAVQCGGTQNICFFGCGTVFEIVPPAVEGGAWTEQTLHTFHGGTDGAQPENGLVADAKGDYYGATQAGGACVGGTQECGTLFKLLPPAVAGAKWTEGIIYTFTGGTDGETPVGAVILDKSGNLYGATRMAGDPTCSCGTVFELTPPATKGAWTETTLHDFTGVPDGVYPNGVSFSKGGALYGTTTWGGECRGNTQGCGVIFQVLP